MSSTDWKRQKVQDHKFDFIDVEDYLDNSLWRKFKYSLVFAVVIKGILIYCADLWTAVNLLVSGTWSNNLGVEHNQISFKNINISFEIYKWIFAACIILSFILLAWDMKKAVAIINSRDISYAFTSMIAYRYYAIKSYAHFCLFEQIHNSKKQIDEIAFFCFFTFRGWKRLMFADGPRQVINGIILITVANKNRDKNGNLNPEIWSYGFGLMPTITMGLMTFTLTLWVISVLMMLSAVILYIPLVIHIRGNLKEFCCHKIDKRIDEIVKKKAKARASEATMNAKTGKGGETPLQKPTLPNIAFIEEGRGRASPTPPPAALPKPRVAAPSPASSPYMNPASTASSPALPWKKSPVAAANDPYRHHQQQHAQHPPRSFSPAPGARSYTPNSEDDADSKPLRQDNYQQAYHNRNLQRQHDPRFDNSDTRSEVGSVVSSHYPQQQPKPQFFNPHRRQGSDASTVMSGSNQGSVINGSGGYGQQRPHVKPHPLQQGQVAHNNNRGPYTDSVMMTNLGQQQHRNPYGGGGGYPVQGRVTGLGGGVGHNSGNGSVVGGGSVVSSGHSYGRPNHGGGGGGRHY
ncbi:MAG: hypothetical protein JOS17DRAFT_150231 [Linnemannia elongata]|nr:MAG: hypothetical protein JOS17DRAFT_150231 [Linnemannia elongata]